MLLFEKGGAFHMSTKSNSKKILALILIVACLVMFFLPWIKIYVNVLGSKYTGYDILEMTSYHGLLMAYNGGLIADCSDGTILSATQMDPEQARQILKTLESFAVTPILDDGNTFYASDEDAYAKFTLYGLNDDELNSINDMKCEVVQGWGKADESE